MAQDKIIIAAKCAPQRATLSSIQKAGLEAVEIYLSDKISEHILEIIRLCKNYPFRYAIHAPNYSFAPSSLLELVEALSAEVVVFHNIYWEDEWKKLIKIFKNSQAKLCIENTYSAHEPVKFMRRYGLKRCLDLEHLQMECAGVFDEVFIPVIKEASHIHLTGYTFGSGDWHTHIHHCPKHSLHMLNLIRKSGYTGFVVSEARTSLQTFREFKQLNEFYKQWQGIYKNS